MHRADNTDDVCHLQLLSSMELAPGEFIQRCHVTTTTGEQMILAFRLCLEERYQPSYRGFTTGKPRVLPSLSSPPSPTFAGQQFSRYDVNYRMKEQSPTSTLTVTFDAGKCWVLRSIKGESAGEEGQCPTEPDVRWGPESVVCGQLDALRYPHNPLPC